MKKIKLMLIALLAVLSTNVFAASDVYGVAGNIFYKYSNTVEEGVKDGTAAHPFEATVVGVKAAATSVVIPSTAVVNDQYGDQINLKVVGFEADWNKKQDIDTKKTVDVFETLTSLSVDMTNIATDLTNAMTNLTALTSLKVFETVAADATPKFSTIGVLKIPAGVKATLVSIDLSGYPGLKDLGDDIFTNAKYPKLTTVSLPATLETIGNNTFEGFIGTSFTLPAALKSIGKAAFTGSKLTSIAFTDKVETIGDGAFENAADLATVDFSKAAALEEIGASAFKGTKLGKTSFKGCAALVEIGESAFEDIETFNAVLGSATALETIGAFAFKGTATENANIPTVETIGESAFEGCEALKAVNIKGVKGQLGISAFKGCVALAKVAFGGEIEEIRGGAFQDCEALATVDFSAAEKLAIIRGNAFNGCAALKSIDLSATAVTSLDKATTFAGCTELAEFILPEGITVLAANIFADTKIAELDLSKAALTKLNDMFGYWDEETSAFKANDKDHPNTTLKTLKLGDGEIPASTFAYFTALETVEMGDGTVGENAFANCTSLTSFKKGNGHIWSNAFENDAKLETVVMGDGIVSANAFYMCAALKTFDYAKDAATIANAINDNAFIGCTYPVIINTINSYVKTHDPAPTNAKYGTGAILTVKTVKDNGGSGKYYMYFHNDNTNTAVFNKADGNFYSIYVDEGIAYFQSVRAIDGKIYVKKGENIIIKTDKEKEVEYTLIGEDPAKKAVLVDEVICLAADTKLVDFQTAPAKTYKYSDGNWVTFAAGNYIYRLTNKAPQGFGFSYYTGETMKAGQFFIISTKAPDAAGRLQTVWLDEDGNVESDATAIEKVEAAEAQDGAIYNLQGVRVNAAKKGLYIQNGKKFIVK